MEYLIREDAVRNKSIELFDGQYSGVAFSVGAIWAQQQIKPMFLLFAKFISDNFEDTVSMVEPRWINLNTLDCITTEELFDIWLKEKQK